MTLSSPEWLLLIPAFLLLGLVVRRLSLYQPLRIVCLCLVALILAKPERETIDQHLDLWVLLDRSESTEDLVSAGFSEWKQILEESKPSEEDNIYYVDYASDVSVQEPNTERAIYTGNQKLTRTQLALEDVLARRSENRPSRIVVFTDGYATEPLHEVANKLSAQGIPVDFRLVREKEYADFRVANIHLPTQTQLGEPFMLGVTVKGHTDASVPLSIYRDGKKIEDSTVELKDGVGQVEFSTRIGKAGSYAYSAKITPEQDAHAGNNTSEKWIQVTGGPRVLLVSNYDNDPVAEVLRNQGYAVDFISDSETLTVGQLAGAKSVIFNNVPAHEIPDDFLKALKFFVKEQGGGFLMVGGKRSFAAGGYYRSPIDPLLPVTMELKNDHRKFSVAMSIVMDRSGSMAATVSDPAGGTVTKMALANNGTAEAINLLGSRDQVAVYAVDSQSSTVVALQSIEGNKELLKQKARKVVSAGGGIYVYTGLKKAWDDLEKSELGNKHIILFSDAADSEEPGDYINLLKEIEKAGATVSVIGLGLKSDPDAAFLEDIAKRGNGRIFFTDKALDLPRLFAQETVTLARSAFLTEPVSVLATGKWNEVSQDEMVWPTAVDAYNLSYARPEASTSLLTKDEYVAPLISHWRRGMGRAAAITFPLSGEHSETVRTWGQYGNSIQTLLNWLNGDDFPPGLTVRHRLEGTLLTVDLLYDTSTDGYNWSKEFALEAPRIKLEEEGGGVYDLSWRRISPGHYSLSKNLQEGVLIKGAIQAGNYAIPFGPMLVGANTEWSFDPDRLAELKALSLQTDGRELTDISKAWVKPEISLKKSLVVPLSLILLVLALCEALVTRIGFSFKLSSLPFRKAAGDGSASEHSTATVTKNRKSKPDKMEVVEEPEAENTTLTPQPQDPKKEKFYSRSERFAKAKRK